MENLQVNIKIDARLYLRDPDSTALGRRIVASGIELIHSLGFEQFTFKKLGEHIGSPESSIYRYFESKHALLIYLVSWYWSWIDYKLVFATINIDDPAVKLDRAITQLLLPIEEDTSISHVNEVLLHEIVIAESSKIHHTKDVENNNEKGCFHKYKQVIERVSNIVLEVNPTFKYPHMLVSTLIEGIQQQRYFAEHLPSLTDVQHNEDAISAFYKSLVFKTVA